MIGSPLVTRRGDQPRFDGEELVVVTSPMFPHRIGKGYDNPLSKVVKEINGVRIKNLRHLVEILRDSKHLTEPHAQRWAAWLRAHPFTVTPGQSRRLMPRA